MTTRRFSLGSLLAFFVMGAGPCRAETTAPPSVEAAQEGMVWRVSGGKVPFFLAGSFHALRPSDYPLPAPYEMAWKEAQHIVMEIPAGDATKPGNQALTMKLAFLKDGKLHDVVSPELWEKVTAWCSKSGYPKTAVDMMKPWMASICIVMSVFEKVGVKGDLGLERHFSERLTKSDKTSEGLETFAQQLEFFDRIPVPMQEVMLKLTLEQLPTVEQDLPKLLAAWRTADTAKVDQMMSRSFEGFPEIKKQLLEDRNAAWIPRLEALLQGGRATMVLVGAAHLCGPGSVVELLQKKGYLCVPLKAAPSAPATAPDAAPAPVKKAA